MFAVIPGGHLGFLITTVGVNSTNCVTSLVSCDGKQITTHVDQIRAQRRLFECLLVILWPFWFFASVQNCSSFCDWHSTDLDSAGRNHVETTKKLYICRKIWLSAISPGQILQSSMVTS